MADKDVMHAIETLSKGRAEAMLKIFTDAALLEDPKTHATAQIALAATLHATADSFRTEADLWVNSRRKGWAGTATQLRQAASLISGVAVEVEKLGPTREPVELSHATNGELVYRPKSDDPIRAR